MGTSAPSILPTSSPTSLPTTPTGQPTTVPTGVPSGQPSELPTEQPTSQPTTQPTGQPSLYPTYISNKNQSGHKRCIKLSLYDTFGDGWDHVKLLVYPSRDSQNHMWYAPSCGQNSLIKKFCFDDSINSDGDYVILKVVGFQPDHEWEIKWVAQNEYDHKSYTGTYDTSMIFLYNQKFMSDPVKSSVSLEKAVNLYTEPSCQSCVSYTNKAPNRATAQEPVFSGHSMSWYNEDGTGANFYISDTNGDTLLYSGTLCNHFQPTCPVSLSNGIYEWRVSGALNRNKEYIRWSFCGLSGTALNSFKFEIKDWICTPVGEIEDVDDICEREREKEMSESVLSEQERESEVIEQMVTVEGVIQLTGMSINIKSDESEGKSESETEQEEISSLTEREKEIVASTIKQEFDEVYEMKKDREREETEKEVSVVGEASIVSCEKVPFSPYLPLSPDIDYQPDHSKSRKKVKKR
eukprot:CAMPEP_0182419618 /NCGR_PEP_ID=MMETSP1167-20130531/4030_1 /TAXON_ID=2988 /ORGANISM="Mallomonas Sp, Strain CCMP3275" /LENGTH=463 /DNA_ID=CAMNT_0024594629 /DNA_START=101 /DNA_END=1493 /DNA_ORIENTATION=-